MIKSIEKKVSQIDSNLTYEYEVLRFAASGLQILKSRIDQTDAKLFITGQDFQGFVTGLQSEYSTISQNLITNYVNTSGSQTISGLKNFTSRPTVNGSGVMLNGESAQVNTQNFVSTSGNQTISGFKTFITGINIVSGTRPQRLQVFNASGTNSGEFGVFGWQSTGSAGAPNMLVIGTSASQNGRLRDVAITGANININSSGVTRFNTRPTVNGTGVLLVGEASASSAGGSADNAVLLTGDQTISGAKTFSPVDSMEFSGADVYFTDNHTYFNTGSYAYVSGTHIFYNGFIMVDETGASWKINIADGQLSVTSI